MKNLGGSHVYGALRAPLVLLAFAAIAGWAAPAKAYTFNTSPDWDVELDTNLAYSLGIRAQKMNHKIGNEAAQQNDEYKFPSQGNVISNRFDISSELSAVYQGNYGFDVSYSAWKDFAYGNSVKTNPGFYAPGVPYSALSSSPSGHLGQFTNHLYNEGGELGAAYVSGNFTPGGIPVSVKMGRFTEYWGNALFSAFQAISYGQNPVDEIKAVDSPGTEVKDLFLPRTQISIHSQVLPWLSLGADYYFEYRSQRDPEGGTFLGVADPLFQGATTLEGQVPRGPDHVPPNVDANFGVEALISPAAFNGTVGLYFRQFDDTVPYGPATFGTETGSPANTNFHLAYARHVQLYGVSVDHTIGVASFDAEASVRTNTGLFSTAFAYPDTGAGGIPAFNNGNDGPRGDTLNVVANSIYQLTPNPIWQTGTLVGEIAWTHVLAVTHDKADYLAVGYAACPEGSGVGRKNGCATQNEVNANVLFDPQWLQVFPGVDIDAPMSIAVGLLGNGPTFAIAGISDQQDSYIYSLGVHALIRQAYNVTLKYSGYTSPPGKVIAGPNGQQMYTGGESENQWNDKGQITLTLSTFF